MTQGTALSPSRAVTAREGPHRHSLLTDVKDEPGTREGWQTPCPLRQQLAGRNESNSSRPTVWVSPA